MTVGGLPGADQISLCMIVRNEERRLGRCLAAARGRVAEMVVVDTGSTDRTVEIAEAQGARVVRRAWRDDFSWARNESLAAATRPWALVLDADEVVHVTDAPALARAVDPGEDATRARALAFSLDCHDLRDDGGVSVAPVMRLFRRDLPDMRYENEVHEQVVAVARGQVRVARADFMHIVHDGYTKAVLAEHRTTERNLALARRMVETRPRDPFAWFCLGQALASGGTAETRAERVAAYERALAGLDEKGGARGESFLVALYLNLIREWQARGDDVRTEAVLTRALVDFPSSPDLRLLRGMRRAQQGRIAEAEADFLVCLGHEAASFFVRETPGASGFLAETQLGLCRVRQGRPAEAEVLFAGAVARAPAACVLPALLLATLQLARGAGAEAEPILRAAAAAKPEDVEVRVKWAQSLLALGRTSDASSALAAVASDPRARSLWESLRRS